MRVLLADDSKTIIKMQTLQFNDLGITDILTAENGEEVLALLKENMPVNIIFLDLNMPVMDGLTCLRKIRKNEEYKDVSVVMCSTDSEEGNMLGAIREGANDYIIKPFSLDDLKDKISD